jgi:hypothetical protein
VTFINVSPLTVYSVGTSGPYSGVIAQLTVQKTGQYMVAWNNVSNPDGDGHHWVNYTLTIAGAQVAVNIPTAIGIGVPSYGGGYWQGHINAGATVVLSASQNGGATNGGGTLVAAFIPTPTERN